MLEIGAHAQLMPPPVFVDQVRQSYVPPTAEHARQVPRSKPAKTSSGVESALKLDSASLNVLHDSRSAKPGELTDAERKTVADMKTRDTEVRRHERAHAAAGGTYAGQPVYHYEHGPDGRQYAVSGEVPIDVSRLAGDPAGTIRKMEIVKRAANAPAHPSAKDRAVAARAGAEISQARAELIEERREQQREIEAEKDLSRSPFTAGEISPVLKTALGVVANDHATTLAVA